MEELKFTIFNVKIILIIMIQLPEVAFHGTFLFHNVSPSYKINPTFQIRL